MSKGGQYLTLRPFFQNKCPKNKQQNIQKRAVGDGIVTLRPLSGSVRLQRICAASSYSSPVRWEPPSRRVFTREVLQFKNQVSQIPNTLRTIWLEIAAKIWLTCFLLPSLWNNVEKLNLARVLNVKYSILGKLSLKLTDWSSKLLYHVHIVLPIWTGLWLPPPSYLFFQL